jgi:peptide deformylase
VTGDGELAKCLQHETDHLRGLLIIDGLEDSERRRVMRQINALPVTAAPGDSAARAAGSRASRQP